MYFHSPFAIANESFHICFKNQAFLVLPGRRLKVAEVDSVKVIGIIGGMSWESSAEYYRLINQEVNRKLGGLHSAEILMFSLDFEQIEKLQHSGKWEEATKIMVDAARRLDRGGADFLIIATNTMHRMADEVQNSVRVPLLHIADATGDRIKKAGFKRVGLLGTIYTMEEDFYKGRLIDRYGLEVSIPGNEDRKLVNDIIYNELCLGKINQSSKQDVVRIIDGLAAEGAEAVILGCTEIPLLIQQKDAKVPLFDTTLIHAETAVARALEVDNAPVSNDIIGSGSHCSFSRHTSNRALSPSRFDRIYSNLDSFIRNSRSLP